MTAPQVKERIDLDDAAPVRLDGDPDDNETMLTWLRSMAKTLGETHVEV